jgi:hypothetical protein
MKLRCDLIIGDKVVRGIPSEVMEIIEEHGWEFWRDEMLGYCLANQANFTPESLEYLDNFIATGDIFYAALAEIQGES